MQMSDLDKLHKKMNESIQKTTDKKTIGIAFSGGVDSSLLAKLCTDLGYNVTLLTVGFAGSHDIQFSKEISNLFDYEHKIEKILSKTFPKVAEQIKKTIKTDNLSWNENCIAFYFVSKLAKRNGIDEVLTANGIDELFCGYNAYRDAIKHGGDSAMNLMESKIENELNMMKAVNTIASEFDVRILQPFLSKEFVTFAKKIPIEKKIHGPDDLMRKHIVRDLALKIEVPKKAAFKPKKALQYGSLIHKALMKIK
ncbi:MAG TPA: asparagine synthase C-terminal domain-containing protein [Nitrosopumilaceae archaeon]|nr:asparagine synthase C-terminal domain-containing protein [Nitrosopumilaceae archaeon]